MFEYNLPGSFKILYCALFQPVIEYGSYSVIPILWEFFPTQLERVQHKFLAAFFHLKLITIRHMITNHLT